ncbi:hypothetical protein ACOJBM_35125 [Rhizobium beringeri]
MRRQPCGDVDNAGMIVRIVRQEADRLHYNLIGLCGDAVKVKTKVSG